MRRFSLILVSALLLGFVCSTVKADDCPFPIPDNLEKKIIKKADRSAISLIKLESLLDEAQAWLEGEGKLTGGAKYYLSYLKGDIEWLIYRARTTDESFLNFHDYWGWWCAYQEAMPEIDKGNLSSTTPKSYRVKNSEAENFDELLAEIAGRANKTAARLFALDGSLDSAGKILARIDDSVWPANSMLSYVVYFKYDIGNILMELRGIRSTLEYYYYASDGGGKG